MKGERNKGNNQLAQPQVNWSVNTDKCSETLFKKQKAKQKTDTKYKTLVIIDL